MKQNRNKVIIWETLDFIGGGQRVSLYVANELKKRYDIEFIVPKEGRLTDELIDNSIEYRTIGDCAMSLGKKDLKSLIKFLWISFKMIIKGIKIVKDTNPAVIYIPGPRALVWGTIVGKITKIPVVWHIHHMFEDRKTKWLLNKIGRFKIVKRIVAVSEIVGKQFISKDLTDKIEVIYNPVDFERFSSGDDKKFRREFNIEEDIFVIGEIGFLQEAKRQDIIIDVHKKLLNDGYNVVTVFVGDSREDTIEYKRILKKKVEEYSIKSSVIFTGYRKDIEDILKGIDLIVIPYPYEGFSLIALEAMAAGVPLVGANTGGANEIIKWGNCGIVFEKNDDARSIADSIKEMINNKDRYEEFKRNGISKAKTCSIDNFAFKISEVISSIGK